MEKLLDEIKHEYALEQGRESWEEFLMYCKLTHISLTGMQVHNDKIAKRFAKAVAMETLTNVSKNVKLSGDPYEIANFIGSIDKESILNENNIPS